MLGSNPVRRPITKNTGYYQLKEIVPTIQGEGIFLGMPAVFVRLGGCNLACKFCDTFFEDFSDISIKDIIDEIKLKSSNNGAKKKLVVITGGEPFRQPIEDLCLRLISIGFIVQIETNGTIFRNVDSRVKIVCSPKVVNNSYLSVESRLEEKVTAFKFLISASFDGYDDIPEKYIKEKRPVFLQPMDQLNKIKNEENMKLAIKLSNKYGFNMGIQAHKIWSVY